jgi:enoyl-[acyl-carrier-protein] reductase (NADH)
MKTIASDQNYIDYTTDRNGVRVRRVSCRSIILQRGRWTEYGVSYPVPVDASLLERRSTVMSSLASNVGNVESAAGGSLLASELRRLVTGEIVYDDALTGALQAA